MIKESSNIKLLLKYHNYSPENNFFHSITNNDVIPTTSNSNNAFKKNHRYSISSIISSTSKINIKNKDINNQIDKNFVKELYQDYLIDFKNNHNYNNLENSFSPKIINIKMCIYSYLIEKKKFDITLDSLILFNKNHNNYQILNDDDNFYQKYNKEIKKINDENKTSNPIIIYYYINNDKIKVIVDLYSKYIDRINLNISKMCSLLMLKFIILTKLREIENNKDVSNSNKINNNINKIKLSKTKLIAMNELLKETTIYGNGIMKPDLTSYIVKNQTNRNFEINFTIYQIYNYYMNMPNKEIDWEKDLNNTYYDNSLLSKDEGILNFIFMEKKDNKCHFGLDFRFTILQYFYPLSKDEIIEDDKLEVINYYNNNFYQIKSGINLYFNCLNDNCKYNQKLFILNIGYGTFDIFNLIKHNLLCPSCNKSSNYYINNIKYYGAKNIKNNLEMKYIGMMNSKWSYKGYLEGIKMTVVDGKGLTVVNNLLYRTKEFNFLTQFKKLLFQADFYISKNNYKIEDNNTILSEISEIKEDIIIDDKNSHIEKIKDINIKLKKEEIGQNTIKNKDIQTKEHNKRNSKKSENFIKFKTEKQITQPENTDFENNSFITLKTKQNLSKKNTNIKNINTGNKRYTHNIENLENNNTNIDFNIIIDKAKTNCCETCFEYDQLSQVCSIF
jgi:hypothetical protein